MSRTTLITILILVVLLFGGLYFIFSNDTTNVFQENTQKEQAPQSPDLSEPEIKETTSDNTSTVRPNGTSVSLEGSSTLYKCASYYIETPPPFLVDADTKIYDLEGNFILSCYGYKVYASEAAREAEVKECALYPLTDECVSVELLP